MLKQKIPPPPVESETPPATEGPFSLFRPSSAIPRRSKTGGSTGILRLLKMIPLLTTGCKMAALLGRPNKALSSGRSGAAAIITLFGYRRGRVSLAMQEDPKSAPVLLLELPILTSSLHREMASGLVKIALESEGGGGGGEAAEQSRSRLRLVDECVWAVYCNGRKAGFSTRKKQESEEERQMMRLLRGVSMGAGVLPAAEEAAAPAEGELTYMRARFERVVGSKDSEALYMINPDGTGAPELSIFLVRLNN
ncbi:protein MIZU-KUSSEI 1-like [Zingiber officinale]|uniref:protein MIZU-KUSSEI 1-like n=1 Tax=Zingiber officinale TaxID=94328 RepID=UPI001C4AB613|nr:protein MIZU-KUSSEI 1-like [Zingiber officinale]